MEKDPFCNNDRDKRNRRVYTVLKGWLIKQGGKIKTWKTRLFTLNTQGEFAYFKTETVFFFQSSFLIFILFLF